jgi:hypothetical protein
LIHILQQRAFCIGLRCLSAATLPEFFDRCVEKNRGNARCLQQSGILSLHKGASAQGYDFGRPALQFIEHVSQSGMLGSPKRGFSGVAENFRHRAALARHDAVIEIFKDPIQPLPKGAAYAALSGSHEADQKNCGSRKVGGRSLRLLAPLTSLRLHVFARTLLQELASKVSNPPPAKLR